VSSLAHPPHVEAKRRTYRPQFRVSGQRTALETRSNRILERFWFSTVAGPPLRSFLLGSPGPICMRTMISAPDNACGRYLPFPFPASLLRPGDLATICAFLAGDADARSNNAILHAVRRWFVPEMCAPLESAVGGGTQRDAPPIIPAEARVHFGLFSGTVIGLVDVLQSEVVSASVLDTYCLFGCWTDSRDSQIL
jgi:hypothetical protein